MEFSKRNHEKLLAVVFFREAVAEKEGEGTVASLTAFPLYFSVPLTFSNCFIFICINKFYCIVYVSHEKIIKIGVSQTSQTLVCVIHTYISAQSLIMFMVYN